MVYFTITFLIFASWLMVHFPALTFCLIAVAAVGVWFVPQTAPEPTYDSSVRAPKDNSGFHILLLVFAPLALAVIWGAAQRMLY